MQHLINENFFKRDLKNILKRKYYNKNFYKEYFSHILTMLRTFIKWILCSICVGSLVGLVGSLFYISLMQIYEIKSEFPYILFLLPFVGLIIVFIYRLLHASANTGTNLVLTAIHSNDHVQLRIVPLIFISTLLTHLCGGSAGKEGAALQMGGSIGNHIAQFFKFDEKDTKIMIMCGMSACFTSVFGTPVASAVFSMEVISVGIMHYAALVPSVISSFTALKVAQAFNIPATHFVISSTTDFSYINSVKFIIMAIFFAIASALFCIALHKTARLYSAIFENSYLRIFTAGILIILARYIFNTTAFLGAGTDIIAQSFTTQCAWYYFLLKIIFTALTLCAGYKGGEIVPTLFIGATLGSFLSGVFGLPTDICAACGMVSLFCGVTNCPITSLLLAIELFNMKGMNFCLICIAVSYMLSGYYSLYNSQKIVYSKFRTEYINKNSI